MKKYILAFFLFLTPIIVQGSELKPDFGATKFDVLTNEELILKDINQILDNYEVVTGIMVSAKIENDNLLIKAGELSGLGIVQLRNKISGKITVVELSVLGANIKVKMVGTDLNYHNIKFNIYQNDELIDTIIINEENIGLSRNLISGLYKIEQENFIIGYKKEETKEVIVPHSGTINLTLTNLPIKTSLKIKKLFDNVLEENINFNIYDENNNLVKNCLTNEMGICRVDLNYGKYLIVQENTFNDEELYREEFIVDENILEENEIVINGTKLISEEPDEEISDDEDEKEPDEKIPEDKKEEIVNPNTSDNMLLNIIINFISLIALLFKKFRIFF